MTDPTDFREQLRRYVCRQYDQGKRYLTAKQASTDLDASSKRIGNHLGRLADEGLVERWGRGSSGITWELTVEQ